jgi:hypothetical protein
MRVLVCGGRDFNNPRWLALTLDELSRGQKWQTLIEGGAKGADRQAREWAMARRIKVQTFEADWMRHGRAAGPIRNQRMLDEGRPNLVVAFPGGRGTHNMVSLAEAAGILVHQFHDDANTIAMRS